LTVNEDAGAHQVKLEKTKLYQTEVHQTLPHVVAKLTGAQLEVVDVDFEKAKVDKDILNKHPSLSYPYIETANG